MSDRDFELNGKRFKLNKIDAFKQFHIVRRIGPILGELVPKMKLVEHDISKLSESDKLEHFAKFVQPLMEGISKLSDADADLVLLSLLSSVEMQQPAGNWAKVAIPTMIMMQELELPMLLQIAGKAFMFNLAGFFAGLPRK